MEFILTVSGLDEQNFNEAIERCSANRFEPDDYIIVELKQFSSQQLGIIFNALSRVPNLKQIIIGPEEINEQYTIGHDEIIPIVQFLSSSQTTTKLSFEWCDFYDDTDIQEDSAMDIQEDSVMDVFAKAIKANDSLSELTFSTCLLAGYKTKVLMEAIKTKTKIKVLELSDNAMDVKAIEAICDSLKEKECPLTQLDLCNNNLSIPEEDEEQPYEGYYYHGEKIVEALAQNLRLKILNVSNSGIGSFSKSFLNGILMESKIELLDMSDVDFDLSSYNDDEEAINETI